MRVEALIDTLDSGGAEFLMADFAEVASDAGIELSITSLKPLTPPAPAADRLRRRGFDPGAVPVRSMIDPRAVARVRRHLARRRPDIVHTHLGTADFLGGVAARSLGIPTVTTIHADWVEAGVANRIRHWLTARVRRHSAARVIAVSDSARAAYLASSGDVARHVVVVRNGIVNRACPGAGPEVRRELGLAPEDIVVSTLSRLRPEKNFEAAIEATVLLRPSFPRLRLVIAGDGPHEGAVRRHAAGLGDAVVLAGHREDAMALLDASDVLVHPSHFDAFPTTLLEAMAASVPVVATGVGGMLEIVEPGVTGELIAPPASAEAVAATLLPLLKDAELRRRLGAAANERFAHEFSAERWATRVREVYEQVLSAEAGPR